MVLKVYGNPFSSWTQAVYMVLKEIEVPYEIVFVDILKGGQKDPEYIENLHPFGQVPVLVDEDGFKLFESQAITRYLIAKYRPDIGLIPKDLKNNALFEQAMSIATSDFVANASRVVFERMVKPMMGQKTNEERVSELESVLEQKLKVYEQILSKQKYLAGDEFTLADVYHVPHGMILTQLFGYKGLTEKPNIARWWRDISSQESSKSVWAERQAFAAKLSNH